VKDCDCGEQMEWTRSSVVLSFDSSERTVEVEAWYCPKCGMFEAEV